MSATAANFLNRFRSAARNIVPSTTNQNGHSTSFIKRHLYTNPVLVMTAIFSTVGVVAPTYVYLTQPAKPSNLEIVQAIEYKVRQELKPHLEEQRRLAALTPEERRDYYQKKIEQQEKERANPPRTPYGKEDQQKLLQWIEEEPGEYVYFSTTMRLPKQQVKEFVEQHPLYHNNPEGVKEYEKITEVI